MPTQICVSASDAITGYWFILIPGLIALFVAFFRWKRSEKGKAIWDRFVLRIPAQIGDVIPKVALARWSRTFSGAVSAGVPMLQAIQLTGETSGNIVLEQAMDDVYASVKVRVRTYVMHQHLLEHLPPPPAPLLDVGGGAGNQSFPLAQAGYGVTLLDPSSAMLDKAQERLGRLPAEARQEVRAGRR